MRHWLHNQTRRVARAAASPYATLVIILAVGLWSVAGFFVPFEFWFILIDLPTILITLLMLFILQNSQSTDTLAMQTKIDELIKAVKQADNNAIALEEKTEDEIQALRQQHERD